MGGLLLVLFSWRMRSQRAMFAIPRDQPHPRNIFTALFTAGCRQRQEEHDSHIVIPQLELSLPSPSLAHSPRIDYFATNYLQM